MLVEWLKRRHLRVLFGRQPLSVLFVLLLVCSPSARACNGFSADEMARLFARGSTDGKITESLQSTGLQAALGGNIHASPYQSAATGSPVERAVDLSCDFSTLCRWRNVPTETLDWSRGDGHADPLRWQFATQTQTQPQEPFALLASNPREPHINGQLVSDPIGCQLSDGQLSFSHWGSLARSEGAQPALELCIRDVDSASVRECQIVTSPSPGPTTFTIPGPLSGPFEFVIRGSHFVNAPEGGFLFVDNIEYQAELLEQSPCPPDFPPPDLLPPSDPPTELPTTTEQPSVDNEASCQQMSCMFNLEGVSNEFCLLNPFGEGAVGRGIHQGWQITTGRLNRANPLTGVRYDYLRSKDGAFAVADFPDPRQERINADLRYVLETPELQFDDQHYLHFKRFVATEGTELLVCTQPEGTDNSCLYASEHLVRGAANALDNRNWVDEVVPLPPGNYKLYIVGRYDNQKRFNAGQIGLSFLKVFRDRDLLDPLC